MARWAQRLGRIALGLIGALVLLAALIVSYETVAGWRSAAEDRALVSEGRTLYGVYCVECHGAQMEGRVFESGMAPPPLKKRGFAFWFYVMPHDMEGFVAGLVGGGRRFMPPLGEVLSAAQRRSLAALIRRANTGEMPLP